MATLISALLRWRLLWLFSALLWGALTALLLSDALLPDPSGFRDYATQEGCIGPPHLAITLTAILTLATFSHVWRRR